MVFFLVFDIDENIIHIYNDKDIKFFRKNLINVTLKCCRSVGQPKRYYIISEVNVSNLKSSLLLIFFADFYLAVGIGEVELD